MVVPVLCKCPVDFRIPILSPSPSAHMLSSRSLPRESMPRRHPSLSSCLVAISLSAPPYHLLPCWLSLRELLPRPGAFIYDEKQYLPNHRAIARTAMIPYNFSRATERLHFSPCLLIIQEPLSHCTITIIYCKGSNISQDCKII